MQVLKCRMGTIGNEVELKAGLKLKQKICLSPYIKTSIKPFYLVKWSPQLLMILRITGVGSMFGGLTAVNPQYH